MSNYEDCSDGPYYPFRADNEFGWGIMHRKTERVFAYVGSKGCAFGVAAALNHKWEAAKVFLDESLTIDDAYFERFKKR